MANTLISNISHIIWRPDQLAHVWYWYRNPDGSPYAICHRCGIRKAENSAMNPPCREGVQGVRANWILMDDVDRDDIAARVEWTSHRQKHILDIKYPHVCFKCKKELYWKELCEANINHKIKWDFKVYKQLKHLWRSRDIQFYCCNCFKLPARHLVPE